MGSEMCIRDRDHGHLGVRHRGEAAGKALRPRGAAESGGGDAHDGAGDRDQRLAEDDGQLLLVANGSFLLNVPLVNHEHRKLAGKLIDAIGPAGQNVVFLESGPGGPPIRDEDPTGKPPSGLAVLTEYPYIWIFVHFAVAGVLYCFACWPIFGVPHELPRPAVSDFGKHIQAMAELLRRSRDRAFARSRLLTYRQRIEEK